MENIKLKGEYLELQQLLKICGLVSTGGEVKYFLANNKVLVNGEMENRRGRKLYIGDEICILDKSYKIC